MKYVNKPVRKKDAMQLVTGQPVYMDDIAPKDCLIVKLLRSPHANAIVTSLNKTAAMKVDGIEAIYTWEDIPQDTKRYTQAGQTYPEMSPYDRLLLDRHVRYVGDVVAIVAGRDEKCVDRALKLIKGRRRTTGSWCIRRTTGRVLFRSGRTIREICAPMTNREREISRKY